jgi:hypothetical protein
MPEMSSLLDPLDSDQWKLIDIVWRQFIDDPDARWPVFSFVDFCMHEHGLDAFDAMSGLPSIGHAVYHGGYRAAWFTTSGGVPTNDAAVYLTLAGLHKISDMRATEIGLAVLACLGQMTDAQAAFGKNPFTVPDVKVGLREALTASGFGVAKLQWVVAIASHEWPGMQVQVGYPAPGEASGSLGALREGRFDSVEDYLVAITAATTPQQAVSVQDYHDPRALLRAIDHFDVTCELVLKQSLVSKPAMARSALLAQEARSQSDLQAGLSALGEIIGELHIPGKNPSHPVGRLEAWLTSQLPNIDRADRIRVQDAVSLLDAVREIRNSGQHPKPHKRLIDAHELLGLPFPIRDPAIAWNIIRAQIDVAFSALQEEIMAAR